MTDKFYQRFEDTSYRLLGEGCYGRAYALSDKSKWVIKTGAASDPWLDYITLCMTPEFENNPHTPNVRFLRINEERDFYVAVIERLSHHVKGEANGPEGQTSLHKLYELSHKMLKGSNYRHHDYLISQEDAKIKLERENPALAHLISVIQSMATRYDYHDENAMISRDGRLVITDPFAWDRATTGPDQQSIRQRATTPRYSKIAA